MLDQNTNEIHQAGVTAHEDITNQVLTIYNLWTGQLIAGPWKVTDIHTDYYDKTDGQGQFTDSPIGLFPDSLKYLREFAGVDIKAVLQRPSAKYSVRINNVSFPLGTFTQTIIQTAVKISGGGILCGNAGVSQSKISP
jgi:hypothetical protein